MDYPTTPLEAIGADGAFQIGGGDFDFGQGYTENLIRDMFEVPLTGNPVEILTQQLKKLPLDALKAFKEMIPGTIDDDFIDVTTAVATIVGNLESLPKALLTGTFDEWVATAFTSVSTELQQILEILGGAFVTPINEAVQAVKDWWTAIGGKTSGLDANGNLSADKLTGQLAKDKIDGLVEDLNEMSEGIQEALANSAQQLRDQLTGIVNATPTDVDNWLLSLLTGESIIPKENVSGLNDALAQAQSQAQQAIRDALTGVVNSTPTQLDNWVLSLLTGNSTLNASKLSGTAPTAVIPTLPQSKITNLVSDIAAKLGVGDPLDATKLTGTAPAAAIPTLPQSKITNLATDLAAKLTAASPLDATKLTGTAPVAAIPNLSIGKLPDLQSVVDAATNALSGATKAGTEATGVGILDAKTTMVNLFDMLTKVTRDVQQLQTDSESSSFGGRKFNIDFGQYPDGAFPSGLFNLTYTGPGTSTLKISGGNATWNFAGNGYRRATMIYPTPTLTPQQIVKGTLASVPSRGTNVRIWSVARANAAGTDFVFARGYCVGFLTFRGDIGCVKGGVEYIWASNVPLTWNLDLRVVCGVGDNPRRHQVYSGNTVVVDLIEPADKQSIYDANHCYWGAISETDGDRGPGTVAGASVADNASPSVTGTTFRAYRSTTTAISKASGTQLLAANTLDAVEYRSDDLTWNGQTLTVSKAGTYNIGLRIQLNDTPGFSEERYPFLRINGTDKRMGSRRGISINGFGVPSAPQDVAFGGDGFNYFLPAGSTITPGIKTDSSSGVVGDAGAGLTYMTVVKVG
ncbi:minor tail subunit [Mycobacterium phage First]|uniref:minor tail protein n=1 Tax=Mycobacterium phage First TaxID=1245814 RepID=UPI0002C0F87B|nr:minor tail protein [Mycobacterium phage First]AFV51157.1 minor tail subunit [Mycobacterium phage First]